MNPISFSRVTARYFPNDATEKRLGCFQGFLGPVILYQMSQKENKLLREFKELFDD